MNLRRSSFRISRRRPITKWPIRTIMFRDQQVRILSIPTPIHNLLRSADWTYSGPYLEMVNGSRDETGTVWKPSLSAFKRCRSRFWRSSPSRDMALFCQGSLWSYRFIPESQPVWTDMIMIISVAYVHIGWRQPIRYEWSDMIIFWSDATLIERYDRGPVQVLQPPLATASDNDAGSYLSLSSRSWSPDFFV